MYNHDDDSILHCLLCNCLFHCTKSLLLLKLIRNELLLIIIIIFYVLCCFYKCDCFNVLIMVDLLKINDFYQSRLPSERSMYI